MMGLLSSIGKGIATGLDYLSGAFTNPVTFVKSPTEAKNKFVETNSKGLSGQVTNVVKTLGTTAVAAGAILGVGAAAGSASATAIGSKVLSVGSTVVKAAAPKTVKGALIQAAVLPVVGTAIIKNPTGAANTVGKVVSAQVDLGKTIASPSKDSVIDFVKDHPVASVIIGAGAVAAAGVGIGTAASIVSNYQNTKAVKENTAATLGGNTTGPEPQYSVVDKSGEFKTTQPALNQGHISPPTPQTQQVSTKSPSTVKRRSRRAAKLPSINQRVNVIVSNKNSSVGIRSTRKLINREILA